MVRVWGSANPSQARPVERVTPDETSEPQAKPIHALEIVFVVCTVQGPRMGEGGGTFLVLMRRRAPGC